MSTDESYDRMRRDFEGLEVEQQARFLVEASASTLAKGIEAVGRALADGLEDAVGRGPRSDAGGGTSRPGPAEPETAQRQAPTNESSADE
jgi:hypothetical protein